VNALRFTRLATLAWACASVAGSAPSAFAGIVYSITNASGIQNGWALSGTITVSGTGTGLGSAAITSWAWTVTKGANSYTYSSNDSGSVDAVGLLATPTALIVPYSPSDASQTNSLRLMTSGGSNNLGWTTGGGRDNDPAMYYANDFLLTFWQEQQSSPAFFPSTTSDGWVIGTVAPVPEIDPATGGSALSLVVGVLAMIEQRRRRATLSD
jgi:hypothetical protein